jgi:hypothetical protein
MSTPVDRDLVAHLLEDETLSYREIARRANCSDWSVRSIARSHDSYDEEPAEPMTRGQWVVVAGIVALVLGAMCFAAWRRPPLDGGMM